MSVLLSVNKMGANFRSLVQMFRKSYCTTSGIGIGVCGDISKMLKFYVKVLYMVGKAQLYVDKSCQN